MSFLFIFRPVVYDDGKVPHLAPQGSAVEDYSLIRPGGQVEYEGLDPSERSYFQARQTSLHCLLFCFLNGAKNLDL